jgi:hypothetical protein
MPFLDGKQTFQKIKANPKFEDVPDNNFHIKR